MSGGGLDADGKIFDGGLEELDLDRRSGRIWEEAHAVILLFKGKDRCADLARIVVDGEVVAASSRVVNDAVGGDDVSACGPFVTCAW